MPFRFHVYAAILGCAFADDGIPRYPPAPDNGRVSLDTYSFFSGHKYTTPVQDTPFWATPGAPPVDFHGDRTSECLEALTAKGDGKFEWLKQGQEVAQGTCSDVKTHFSLCEHAPPRECLISRIPWQTATSAISCCFHCCMHYWQDNLGLSDIYRHWFENKENPHLRNWDYSSGYRFMGGSPGVLDPKDQVSFVPDLDSVVLTVNSVRRFSLFMWNKELRTKDGRSTKEYVIYNATRFVQHNGGGGVVQLHGPHGPAGETTAPFTDEINDYVTSHPVSTIHIATTWKLHYPFSRLNASGFKPAYPTGGHFFANNAITSGGDGPIVGIPLGADTAKFEHDVGDLSQVRNRSQLLMCCCMTDRANRGIRIRELESMSGGVCSDLGVQKVSPKEFARRMADSKFVLSPVGAGKQCYRDSEIIAAGAVAVLDGFISGGHNLHGGLDLFDASMPAIHVPLCNKPAGGPKNRSFSEPISSNGISGRLNYCYPESMTKEWFEKEYAKLEARRHKLNVAKVYWPYWLYHVFIQVPARGTVPFVEANAYAPRAEDLH